MSIASAFAWSPVDANDSSTHEGGHGWDINDSNIERRSLFEENWLKGGVENGKGFDTHANCLGAGFLFCGLN
jgi:hypothetical protein